MWDLREPRSLVTGQVQRDNTSISCMVVRMMEKSDPSIEWIDISNPTKVELKEISARYNLHRALVEDSLQPEHLPKYEKVENIHFLILRVYSQKATRQSYTIQQLTDKIAIFIASGFIITIHRKHCSFLEEIRAGYAESGKCQSTYDILQKIILMSFLTYEQPLGDLIGTIETLEPEIFLQKRMPALLQDLYYLKRRAYVINKLLNLSRGIVENLSDKIPAPDLNNLKDTWLREYTNSDHVMDNSNTLLNTYISLTSQRTNEVVRVLTVFSVFFMPLTFIVGIYGMNFDFMPELQWKAGYPAVLLVMVLVTIGIYLWFRRKGWL